MNSKSTAGILIAGTLVLAGGSALAAMVPSRGSTHHARAATARQRTELSTHDSNRGNGSSSAHNTTYTVRVGDTLPDVDRWLHHHGYGRLWATNRAALGSETHLLFPGERITVRNGVLTTRSPST
jgi:hypothetical protein